MAPLGTPSHFIPVQYTVYQLSAVMRSRATTMALDFGISNDFQNRQVCASNVLDAQIHELVLRSTGELMSYNSSSAVVGDATAAPGVTAVASLANEVLN